MTEDETPLTEAQIQADMDEIDKNPASIVKTVLICLKAGYLIFISFKAAYKWSGQLRIQALLITSALLTGAVTYYKTTSKEIAPLFLLQGLSMLITTLCLPALLTFPKRNESARAAFSSSIRFQMMINLGFVLILGAGLFGNAAHCNPEEDGRVIPWGFLATFGLFVVHFLYTRYLH